MPRDVEELAARLDQDPEFRILRVSDLSRAADISASARYHAGDLIRVPRTGGAWSLGVVSGRTKDGLQIILRIDSGALKFKELTSDRVDETNPLKIGDVIQLEESRFWVRGLDEDGDILVLSDDGSRVDPLALKRRLALRLGGEAETVQMDGEDLARLRAVARAAVSSKPPEDRGTYLYTPLESIFEANTQLGLVAGNSETDTVFGLQSPFATASLHTNKGENYKSWNEDAAALFADKKGRLYVGVFDQAGGEGEDENYRGAASAIAAKALFDRMQTIARSDGDEAAVEAALAQAVKDAHETILGRGKGEVSTFVGARIDGKRAIILNVGDSGVVRYSGKGELVDRTEPQGFGRLLLEGVGMLREGARLPKHDLYRWDMNAGDYLVFGSDGLFDSKLGLTTIGELVAESGDSRAATRKLRDLISSRMKTKEAKPDNLTILVVRVER
ncbi:MAG: SpoIIE family protein phosphatase [Deltaproteobacteria bacterium]|nr:SpoIIE family protein phosphatase [Deltaproteobacteria bacterium]